MDITIYMVKTGDNPKYKMHTMTNIVNDGNIYTTGINGKPTIVVTNNSTNSFPVRSH